MIRSRYRKLSSCLFLLAPLAARSAFAQADQASIVGTVTDASGAAVAGAAVKSIALSTNQERGTVTNAAGIYEFPFLSAGEYRLRVEAAGFQAVDVKAFAVQVGQVARVDLSLKLGQVSERVEVSASGVGLQTESASVGTVIDNTKIVELPLNGRSFIQLALLTPGVNPATPGSLSQRSSGGSLGQPVGMNANGARDNQNRYYYDGLMAMSLGSLSFSFSLSIDAIQEFKVDTSNYSAQIGAAPGGQVNLTTKGGSNTYHGTLWEFNRNNELTTLAPFQAYSPNAAPPRLNRNQFGANLGGPFTIPKIYKGKDRTFFFFNWESGRLISGTSGNTAFVPPAAYRTGDFSSSSVKIYDPSTPGVPFPGNVIPASRIQSYAAKFLAYVPLPNSNQAAINYYSPASSAPTTQDQYVGRVDQRLSDRNSLSMVYDYNQQSATTVPSYTYWDFTRAYTLVKHAVLSDIHTFSPSIVNEARMGWDRRAQIASNGATGVSSLNIANAIGIGGVSQDPRYFGSPTFSLGYDVPTTASIGPASQGNQLWQYEDNVSVQKGRHSFHLGGQIMRWNEWFEEAYNPRGSFTFDGRTTTLNGATANRENTFAAYLLGLATSASISPGVFQTRLNTTWQGYYFQDDWKILPNLTLNYGIRYEYFQPMVQRGKVANFALNGVVPGFVTSSEIYRNIPGIPDTPNYPSSLVNPDKNDFGPRAGFAWVVPHSGDLVMRGAYGIFFTPELPNSYIGLTYNPPIVASQAYTGTYLQPISVATAFSQTGTIATGQLGSGGIDPNLRDTYVQQWNLTFQKKLPGKVILDVGYVGNKGTNLTTYFDGNRPIDIVNPATATSIASRRPLQGYSALSMVKSIGNSTYHSLQMKAERRVSNGLTFIGAYTWSKALTTVDQSSVGGGFYSQGIQNVFNLAGEKSPASFDLRHRFSLAAVYDIPWLKNNTHASARAILGGWQLSVIDTQQTGVAAGLTQVGDTTGTGISSRPSVVYGQSATVPDPTRAKWFNTAAFVMPAPGTFGTAARTIIYLPGLENVDASLSKNFRIKERANFQFRADIFNVLNHVNLGVPGLNLNTPNTFGVITTSVQGSDTSGTQRIIQLGAKLTF